MSCFYSDLGYTRPYKSIYQLVKLLLPSLQVFILREPKLLVFVHVMHLLWKRVLQVFDYIALHRNNPAREKHIKQNTNKSQFYGTQTGPS